MTRQRRRQVAFDVALSLVLIALTAVFAPKLWHWAPRALAGEEAFLEQETGPDDVDPTDAEAAAAEPEEQPPDALGFVTTTTLPRLTEPVAGLNRLLAPDRVIRVNEDSTAEFGLGKVDGHPEPVDILTEPALGLLTRRGNGSWLYRPNPDAHGLDEFSYQVCLDGQCEQGVVLFTVASLNDPPVAVDDDVAVGSGQTALLTPAGNDFDPDVIAVDPEAQSALTIVAVGVPTHGTAALLPDGTVEYRAPELLPGPADDPSALDDTFTYVVCDAPGGCSSATVTIRVTNMESS